MIKTTTLNDIKISPFWKSGAGSKPVTDKHGEITKEPYPNILVIAKKKSGKTTMSLYLIIKHFMTNKTNLCIFSTDITKDKDNMKAIEIIQKKLPDNLFINKSIYDKEGNSLLLSAVDNADEMFQQENKSKHAYPVEIIYYDDLPEDELKDKAIGELFQTNRHHGIMNILSTQRLKNCDVKCRQNCDILILFTGQSKEKLKDIFELAQPNVTFDEFIKMYKFATAEPRSFLFIDIPGKSLRKNLSEELYIKDL